MLLLLLLFHQATADIPPAPRIVKNITSCPDVGYFFQQEVIPNAIAPGPCLLCFCRGTSSAVCWRRDSSRCDTKNYRHYGNREARVRRSPAFSDIFFRDAARDRCVLPGGRLVCTGCCLDGYHRGAYFCCQAVLLFDKRFSEQCKPYESSFSEGCPPADWCIGCTVCDCDANGRWDCHILSFCPDKKGKKQPKKQNIPFRKRIVKRNDKTSSKTRKIPNVKNTKPVKKPNMTPPYKKSSIKQSNLRKANFKNIKQKKISQVNKTKPRAKKATNTKPANKKIINKKPSAHEISKKTYRSALQNVKEKNDTYKLAEAIVKRVMSKVERIMSDNQKKAPKGKVVQKRSMQKHYKYKKPTTVKSKNVKHNKTVKKVNQKPWNKKIILKEQTSELIKGKRQKRSVTPSENTNNISESTLMIWENITKIEREGVLNFNATTLSSQPINYYRYDVNSDNKSIPLSNDIMNRMYDRIDLFNDTSKDFEINSNSIIFPKRINSTPKFYKSFLQPLVSQSQLNKSNYDEWEDLNETLKKQYLKHTSNTYRKSNIFLNVAKKINRNNGDSKEFGLKKIFKEFFFGLHPNNTDEVKNKVKNINVLSMLKNLLKDIFDKKKNRSKKYIKEQWKHKSILNALCKNFGACQPDLNDKKLKSKLNDLKKETYDILKIVNSIKGLLYFLNNNGNVTLNKRQESDIEKLKAILRQHYKINSTLFNITETQRIQVNYIKQNAEQFVKSVEKFAYTLSDILNMIEKQNKSSGKRASYRYLRCVKHLKKLNDTQIIDDKITRLKKLLLSYNLVQNRFMSKMYDALLSLQGNVNVTTLKPSEKIKYVNNSATVDTYSNSIITNLRKLKNLSKKLNPKKRLKRAVMGDEDAIEYLLMLMEYLLKQKPVDSAPVNDGIDLLIDAIKNAPDIKPIKNNVIRFKPVPPNPTRTTESLENDSKILHTVENKIIKSNDKILKTIDLFGAVNDKNMKFHATPAYKANGNLNIINKNKLQNAMEEATESFSFYINAKQEATDKGDNFEDKVVKTKYDIFNADAEEEYDGIDSTTKKSVDTTIREGNKAQIEMEKENEKLQNIVENDVIIDKDQISAKLDWVDDIADRDVKSSSTTTELTTKLTIEPHRTLKSRLVTRTSKKRKDKYASPVSSMSSEELDRKKQYKKSNIIGVGGKQMDLFNSLDYNTEKMEIESESKEDKNDAFSDFV